MTPRLAVAALVLVITGLRRPAARRRLFVCLASVTGTVSGVTGHAFLSAMVPVTVLILALLTVRATIGRLPFLAWPTERHLLAGAAALNLLIVAVAFIVPAGYIPAPNPHHLSVEPLPLRCSRSPCAGARSLPCSWRPSRSSRRCSTSP